MRSGYALFLSCFSRISRTVSFGAALVSPCGLSIHSATRSWSRLRRSFTSRQRYSNGPEMAASGIRNQYQVVATINGSSSECVDVAANQITPTVTILNANSVHKNAHAERRPESLRWRSTSRSANRRFAFGTMAAPPRGDLFERQVCGSLLGSTLTSMVLDPARSRLLARSASLSRCSSPMAHRRKITVETMRKMVFIPTHICRPASS